MHRVDRQRPYLSRLEKINDVNVGGGYTTESEFAYDVLLRPSLEDV